MVRTATPPKETNIPTNFKTVSTSKRSPAPITRSWTSAKGAKPRSASFTATMFAAQQAVARSIRTCIRPCLAGRARCVSGETTCATEFLSKSLLPDDRLFDPIEVRHVTETRCLGDSNRAPGCDLDFGVDDVLLPVAPAGRNVAREVETRERRQGDVTRASDP